MENKEVPVFIEGKIISFTPQCSENVELYSKWMNNPKVRRYARWEMPRTVEDIKRWFEPREGRVQRFVGFEMWHNKDNKPIGQCGLAMIDWINGWANAWLYIGEPDYWNKNIATEATEMLVEYAFGELNLHKLQGGAAVENVGSWSVAEKIGFKYNGIVKDEMFVDGKYRSVKTYGILKEDWLKQKINLSD
jgi:ribosomal-protein-alanine N-acetyltransferase